MSDAWFHVDAIPGAGERIALDARESRHAAGVKRLREDERITVFDGDGRVASATICHARGKAIEIELGASHVVPPLVPAIHLAVALPKGDRQSVMLNMVTQLGVASITPLACERSIVQVGRGFADRAARICIEACKQSRNARLPAIHQPRTLADVISNDGNATSMTVIAHPDGRSSGAIDDQFTAIDSFTILVGPEGGFTDEEVEALRGADTLMVSLGRTILRTETAAVALTSFLRLGLFGRR